MTLDLPEHGSRDQGKVILVCTSSEEQNVRRTVLGLIHTSAEQDQSVQIVAIPDGLRYDKRFVTDQIRKHLPSGTPFLLVPTQLAVNSEALSAETYLLRPNGVKTLLRRYLPRLLKQLRLDWISRLDDMLHNGWHHGPLDRNRIERWIQQFEHCGNHRWVAEGLLKSLDFWSDTRTQSALRINSESLKDVDCICINRHAKAGKSADVIANLVRKRLDADALLKSLPLLDIRIAVASPDLNRIVYVEDCSLSGNEMERVLRGLLGMHDPYGSSKAEPLENPEMLRTKQIDLRFAVLGNGGIEHIRWFLQHRGLTNISIDTTSAHILPMMTPDGLSALQSGSLYDREEYLQQPDLHMNRKIFEFWENPEKRQRARRFCEEVGRQLYAAYLLTQSKTKPPRWIDECALGVRSAALTVAFAHSVPKETLPLFWAEGEIRWNNRSFYWNPLFLNAG